MFKALDTRHNQEIVTLDEEWDGKLDYLRSLGRQDVVVCPLCKQPVRFKAGRKVRRHFAHKHRHGCHYGRESVPVLMARACLYRWLKAKFPGCVTVEKDLGDHRIPHPVDCWVEYKDRRLAYWIVGKGMNLRVRSSLPDALSKVATDVTYVFVADMLRRDDRNPHAAHLSVTERELMVNTPYDALYCTRSYLTGESLHYLDGEKEELTTFRHAMGWHGPQYYEGQIVSSPLSQVRVRPKTGQFVHPGEHERLAAQEASLSPADRRWRASHPEYATGVHDVRQAEPDGSIYMAGLSQESPRPSAEPPAQQLRVGTCIFCGARTADHWWYDGATGTCRCRSCYHKGLVSPEDKA